VIADTDACIRTPQFEAMFNWLFPRHGVHVVTCPDNHEPAAVTLGSEHLRSCSRWPEKAGCDEACLAQIEASPDGCLVKTIVTKWYEGKHCHYCAKDIGRIVWHERPPAVRLTDGTTREWKTIPPEQLPRVFATGAPACWACHIVETFRRERPELVVQRPRMPEEEKTLQPSTNVY
jgi:hypothetical protein